MTTPIEAKTEVELEEIQAIFLAYDDPSNGGAGHHNVVFATKQVLALLDGAVVAELENIKDLDEPANYEQGGKAWTGLAIPRNKVIERLAELKRKGVNDGRG